MNSRVGAGIMAGMVAGLLVGFLMQNFRVTVPGGDRMPMMAMVASLVGSASVTVGWLVHLISAAVLGAVFAWWFGARVHRLGSGLGWGGFYGLILLALGGLVVLPLLLGSRILAPLTVPELRPLATGTFVAYLVYGLILGGVYAFLKRERTYMLPHGMRRAA